MFKLAALNDKEIEDKSASGNAKAKGTKEAQEVHAFDLYNKALQLQRDNQNDLAFTVYEQLLKTSLVNDAAHNLVDENGEATQRPLKDPGLILKYSTHKNLASISADKGDIETAMEHYLQAVMLDTTDVTLWQRIGSHAITLGKLALARHAFTSGLSCNENYWPCLDSAVTVLFALLDYESSLYWIAKALERNREYAKGLILRERMYKDCPHLRKDTQHLFRNCDFTIYDLEIDEDEVKEYIDEALALRERHRKSCVPVPPDDVPIRPALKELTWVNLGNSIVETYDYIFNTDDNATFTSRCIFNNIKYLEEQLEIKKQTAKEVKLTEDKKNVEDATQPKSPYIPGEMSEDSVDSLVTTNLATEPHRILSAQISVSFDLSVTTDNFYSSQDSTQDITCYDDDVIFQTDVRQLVLSLVDDIVKQEEPAVTSCDDQMVVKEIVDEIVTSVSNENVCVKDECSGVLGRLLDEVVKEVDGGKEMQEGENPGESSPKLQDLSMKGKRTGKRKRNLTDLLDENSKRRSTRVRVSTKKGQQQILKILSPPTPKTDYRLKLCRLLPPSLLLTDDHDKINSTPNKETTKMPNHNDSHAEDPKPVKYDAIKEADDVLDFLKNNDGEAIVDLLQRFCFALSDKAFLQWPFGTREVLIRAFACTQPHLHYLEPEEVEGGDNIRRYRDTLYNVLNFVECQIDHNEKKTKTRLGVTANDLESLLLTLETALPHRRLFRTSSDDLLPNSDLRQFGLRFLWARSKLTGGHRSSKDAVRDLNVCKDLLEFACRSYEQSELPSSSQHGKFFLQLPNLHVGSIISLKTVKERLAVFERKKVLDDVKRLFESESYSDVIQLLTSTLTDKPQLASNPERPRQIRQLLISHEKVHDKIGVVESARCVVAEIVLNAQKASAGKENRGGDMGEMHGNKRLLKEWTSTLHVVLQILARALKDDVAIFEEMKGSHRAGLCQNLASAMGFIFTELDEGRSFLAKTTVSNIVAMMWIVMYKVVKFDEKDVDFSSFAKELPASFGLLNTAHQWTGARGMCCQNDGMLLRFVVEEYNVRFKKIKHQLLPAMRNALTRLVEQCFYCLFAFPNKGKVRYLQDHNVKQLSATWTDFLAMFNFSRPPHLPEFDSFKAITVSLDLSQLILRALNHVPQSVQAQVPNSDSDVINFVETNCNDVTVTLTSLKGDCEEVRALGDMYYLLGDYYFKNREMTKAVKYYLLDLRINPKRFDSWAGMALARSSQTDDRLRLCENKKSQHKPSDSGTEKKGLIALSCFKRALSFESGSGKLWIEYATLAYWMHSMYSRQLKRKSVRLSDDERKIVADKKIEMLKTARKCFEVVRESDSDDVYDEEWLIEYMIGKLCEKEGKPLSEYLRCYQSSTEILHRRHAKYPKRILPKYGAVNDLAIEALEMHFRVHASILKYLLVRIKKTVGYLNQPLEYDVTSDELFLMKDVVEQMSRSPFVHREERKPTSQFTVADPDKPTKLAAVSESSDLTMGSLLPDAVLNALNIEVEERTDDDTQPSVTSTDGDTQGTVKSDKVAPSPRARMLSGDGTSMDRQSLESMNATDLKPQNRVVHDSTPRHREDCEAIIDACESALRLCLRRFPQHNKSAYRLAHLYSSPGKRKHLNWARDLLFGSPSPWQQTRHMPAAGLLADRNKTNLFNGVWRIPMDEIDRPGSFAAHLRRCVALLIDVMRGLRENESLLHLHNMLNRIPDHGRKYLRDDDRILLARLALVYCRSVLNRKIRDLGRNVAQEASGFERSGEFNKSVPGKSVWKQGQSRRYDMPLASLSESVPQDKSHNIMEHSGQNEQSGTPSTVEESLNIVMEAYKVYQDTQKHPDSTTKLDTNADEDDVTHRRLLADAYHKYTCCVAVQSSNDGNASLAFHSNLPDSLLANTFEQAVRFCQRRVHSKKQSAANNTKSQVTSTTSPKDRTQTPPDSGGNVIHDDAMRSDSGGATAAANHVRDLSIVDVAKGDADSTANAEGAASNPAEVESKNADETVEGNVPKVTMVEKEGKKYTRIGLPSVRPGNHPLVPSRDSAFTSTDRKKRLKVDPGLKHLQLPSSSDMNGSHSKKLVRSTSVPVARLDEEDADAENKPPFNTHRAIYRTGSSVSDYTLDRLKKSILARTSAALVRKPSITEQEIMQITNDVDYDSSSQSEDEEEGPNEDGNRSNKRKYCEDAPTNSINPDSFPDSPVTSPLAAVQSTAITTAGST